VVGGEGLAVGVDGWSYVGVKALLLFFLGESLAGLLIGPFISAGVGAPAVRSLLLVLAKTTRSVGPFWHLTLDHIRNASTAVAVIAAGSSATASISTSAARATTAVANVAVFVGSYERQ